MRDAINISVLKTLSDWKVPQAELRQAAKLLKTAALSELEDAWIVHIEKRAIVSNDIWKLGMEALGIERHGHDGLKCVPVEGKSPEETAARTRHIAAMSEEGLSALLMELGTERFKYARYFEQQPAYEFLHDLKADPDELKNLAADPAHADDLARLRRRTDELRDRYASV